MPSTYAHYVFGKRMLELFPEDVSAVVRADRQLYDIGLHGPDILFYYHVLTNNKVNAVGFGTHARPAKEFFAPAKAAVEKGGAPAFAYLVGFLCHFALDVTCHSYIENKIAVSDVRHTEIESEFDRFLLEKDGKEPLSAKLTGHIFPTAENAHVIAPFFAGLTEKQIRKSLRSMLTCNEFVRAPHAFKRFLVNTVLHLSGNWKEMHGMMIAKQPIPACRDSNLRLEKLMKKAEGECLSLLADYRAYLAGQPLSSAFDRTFGAGEGWQNVPVLSEQEEKNYEV